MNQEEAIAIIRKEYLCVDRDCDIERNCGKCDLMIPSKEPILEAYKMAIQALEQELLCDRLAREYISKVKYCDECFASTFCTINGLRNSRVPQDYCIENIKKYFENKASLTGSESEEKNKDYKRLKEKEPCEDAISRQAALDAMYELCGEGSLKDNPWRDNPHIDAVVEIIEQLKPVNPQPKMGRWIRVDKDKLKCSECEVVHFIAQYPQSAKINYCPNCGQPKMQEVEE